MTTISSTESSCSSPVEDSKPAIMSTSSDKLQPSPSRFSAVTVRLMLAITAAATGSFTFGYSIAVINSPETIVENFINETVMQRTGVPILASHLRSYWSLIVAIFAIGGMIGGLSAGAWADFFGRKKGMLLNNAIGIAGSLLIGFSKMGSSFEMIIVGRVILGFNCGLTTCLTPMYLSEIAPANIRGALGVVHQLAITIGILMSQIFGFQEILGTKSLWPVLLGLPLAPCIIQLMLLPLCPESPRFLLITKHQETEARAALVTLRGKFDVDLDIEDMKSEQRMCQSEPKISIAQLIVKSSLRKQLVIGIVMQISQQSCGILAILYYSHSLFVSAGMLPSVATHAVSGIGAVMVVMTFISIPLMEYVGRRTLHLTGLMGMFVLSIVMTLALTLNDTVKGMQTVGAITVIFYVAAFSIGPGSIPWLIVAELFPQGSRAPAMSICTMINWLSNFINGFTFPYVQKGLDDLSFVPFTILLLLFWGFTYMYLPETKDKTIEQITDMFRQQQQEKQSKTDGVAKENSYLVGFKKM